MSVKCDQIRGLYRLSLAEVWLGVMDIIHTKSLCSMNTGGPAICGQPNEDQENILPFPTRFK
jgi:hypothetical protein